MRFRHIFVVTHGPSGSTLLTGILNSIPGVCVRGENGGVLERLHAAIGAATTAQTVMTGDFDTTTNPWFGGLSMDVEAFRRRVLDTFVQELLKPPKDAVAIGFKEIRYGIAEMADATYEAYLEFMLSSFERSCLIFNVRRTEDAARSAWLIANPLSESYLRRTQIRFRSSHSRYPDNSYWVDYDRYVNDPEQLRGLFDFLGARFDRTAIDATMAVRHSLIISKKEEHEYQASRSIAAAIADDLALRVRRWAGRK